MLAARQRFTRIVALFLLSAAFSVVRAEEPSYSDLLETVQDLQERLAANEALVHQLREDHANRDAWQGASAGLVLRHACPAPRPYRHELH